MHLHDNATIYIETRPMTEQNTRTKHGANSDGKKPQPIDTSLKNNREIWNKTADIEIRRQSRFIKHGVKIM